MTTENLDDKSASTSERQKKVSLLAVMSSVFAASFGVQTKTNRERDFAQGKFHHFVIGGIVFAVLFVLFLVTMVKVVLYFAAV